MLTDAQTIDVRRFAGYPTPSTIQTLDANTDTVFVHYGTVYMSLYTRLTTLDPNAETVLTTTYLANLYTLESAIPGATANLDTDSAAVWKHNPNEVRDRQDLFDRWRRAMCDFLGLPYGPGLSNGGGAVRVVRG